MELDKKQIEALVEEKLGCHFDLTFHTKGRWESKEFETCFSTSLRRTKSPFAMPAGIFSNVITHVQVDVRVETSDDSSDFMFFGIGLHWQHVSGGSNGYGLDFWYHIPSKKLMTRKEIEDMYKAMDAKKA